MVEHPRVMALLIQMKLEFGLTLHARVDVRWKEELSSLPKFFAVVCYGVVVADKGPA
jgi:hypothetical protein